MSQHILTPLPAEQALDRHFLDARCRLLDVAAILDRIGRGDNAHKTATDPRLARVRQAIEVLVDGKEKRAERIQQIFSLDYDQNWVKPKPK
jgi:hypothetical protein